MSDVNWWALFGYVLTVISISYAISTNRKRRKELLHRQQRFEWTHVEAGVQQLCRWITRKFKPDFLLAIPGAGLILTGLAVIELGDVHPVFMAQQLPSSSKASFPQSGKEFCTAKWRYWLPDDLLSQRGKKVLILDDYTQSGDALIEVRKALEDSGFDHSRIRTAALVSVRGLREAGKQPDFTWFWVDGPDVHKPWGHASKKVRTGAVEVA